MRRFLSTVIGIAVVAAALAAHAESAKVKAELAALAKVKGPYQFAVIGDNRSGDRVYKKVIDQMMRREPLFVLNTGDVIPQPGNREEWANFKTISEPITVPYFLVPGNHDIDSKKSQEAWRDEADLPGRETYYSFTVGPDLFVALNTCEPDHDRRIEGEQLAWLSRALAGKKYRHIFVLLHHPLFFPTKATHKGDSLDLHPELREKLHRLFVDRGVEVVFEGHEHSFSRLEKDGIAYIISGGGGAPLYGKEAFNHVLMVRVDGARIEAKAIDRDGMMRDEFVIEGQGQTDIPM